MDIVNNFKSYLLAQRNGPSKITVKNYIADVRKFVAWYESTYQTTFIPEAITTSLITHYNDTLEQGSESSLPAARSTKRYISSLRKFCAFLEETGAIKANPFKNIEKVATITDPYYFKEFRNYLFTEHASKLTIKNYMADIKQFIDWLDHVVKPNNEPKTPSSLLTSIDNYALEQYKMRLYKEVQLSPVSINRKLSSMRRYLRWLAEKGVVNSNIAEPSLESRTTTESTPPQETVIPELPLTALQGMAEETEKKAATYSNFGPLRLFQRTTKIISLGTDLLFFNPIAHAAEAIQYSFWKKSKKQIFAPVNTILEASSYIPQGVSIKTIIPKGSSILAPRSANLASIINKVQQSTTDSSNDPVHNFTKALYAPLKISTDHMDWKEKLLHKLRYSRPAWYKKYHSYAFVHYLHFGIMILATVIAGAAVYQTWYGSTPKQNEAVLSAQATAPPRTLSFQGRLLDNTNTPITAETPLRFALYNSPTASGAALLWQEKQNIIPDHNGYFTAVLGKKQRLEQQTFTDNPSLYVGISVGDNQELTPRQQIPTTDYAANSQSVEGMKPITDSTDVAQNVLLALDSSGNLTIGGSQSHTFQATGGQFNVAGQAVLLTTNPGSNGNITIAPDGSGIIDLQKPLQNTSNYSTPGIVPGAVGVNDILSVLATSSSQSALVINQNGSGDIISGQNNGIDKFRLDSEGNEFLAGDLIINGDTIGTTSSVFDIAGANVTTLNIGNNARVLSLGASSGITSINNSIAVHGTSTLNGAVNANGLITANAGITVPDGQKISLGNFPKGALPFINESNQLVQDANRFSWDDTSHVFHVVGSLCVNSITNGSCDSTPGTITSKNLNTTGTADLAENYISSQDLEPGDLVVPEGLSNNAAVVKSTTPYQHQLIGIISTNPGITLNSDAATDSDHPHVYPLALQGRVPVKVSTVNGPIQAGDNLTSSAIPGVAMRATDSGQIIGKALESYVNSDPNAIGKVMAFVNLSYQSTPTTITASGDLAAASESALLQPSTSQTPQGQSLTQMVNDITSTIALGADQAQTITSESLHNATDTIMIGGQSLKDYVTTLVEGLINQELDKRFAQLPHDAPVTTPTASNSATMTDETASPSATPIPTASSSGEVQIANPEAASTSGILEQSPTPPIYNSIASASAAGNAAPSPIDNTQTGTQTNSANSLLDGSEPTTSFTPAASLSGDLTYVPNFKADFGTFNQGLVSLGPTSLTDVGVSNTLTINNNLRITDNALNTISSDLNIEPLRQGNVLFMGGLVAIDTQGNLQVNGNATFAQDVNVHGQLAAGIIAPIPNQDLAIHLPNKANKTGSALIITNATGSGVLQINQSGDVISSGEAQFASIASHGFSIIRGAEADTSMTETVADGSAGKGVITAYETERTIVTPYVTDHSLIYVTATSATGNVTPYLARQTVEDPKRGSKGSFTVAIPSYLTKDISFNWWIVN